MEKQKATLIKVFPVKREIKCIDGSKKLLDSILIFYRDENGEKKTKFIDRAESPFYILKDKECEEARTQPLFIEKDKVELVPCYSDDLFHTIAARTDSLPFYDDVLFHNGENSSNMKNLFKHPWIYEADMDLSDRYIRRFHDMYDTNPAYKLYKCYFDIEVDIINYNGFPDEEVAPAPINIITLIDERLMSSHSFIVRNQKNNSLIEFERDKDDFIKYLDEKIKSDDQVVLNSFELNFYNTELEAIEAFFKCVHEKKPDYMLA